MLHLFIIPTRHIIFYSGISALLFYLFDRQLLLIYCLNFDNNSVLNGLLTAMQLIWHFLSVVDLFNICYYIYIISYASK